MKSDTRSFYTVKRLSILYKVTTLLPSADWELSLQARGLSMLNGKGMGLDRSIGGGRQARPRIVCLSECRSKVGTLSKRSY